MRRFIVALSVVALLIIVALVLVRMRSGVKPFPASGSEHPFASTVAGVDTARDSGGISTPRPVQPFVEASSVSTIAATLVSGTREISLTLEATREVPTAALRHLAANLQALSMDPQRQDLEPFAGPPGKLMHGQPEVRLPVVKDVDGRLLMPLWPDGWDIVRPRVIRLRPEYVTLELVEDAHRRTQTTTLAIRGDFTEVQGVLQCRAPGETAQPLGFVEVHLNGVSSHADASGAFSISGRFTEVDRLTVRYDGRVTPLAGVAAGPRISVMNDFHNPRSEDVATPTGTTTDGVLDVGALILSSLDCELFELGSEALSAFHRITSRDPPAPDDLRIKRWEGVSVGLSYYSYYDYVVITNSFRQEQPSREQRRQAIFHEFGHTVRHAADGDLWHWGWDSFRWAYGRLHEGHEIFNEQYAFNEGWATYWECTRTLAASATCPEMRSDVPGEIFLDWNEMRIGERLLAMAVAAGVGHAAMVDLLIANPGSIHTFREFEVRYCEQFNVAPFCVGSRPMRVKTSCPQGFADDGATCRQENIVAKHSFGRGVGTLPTGCGSREMDSLLCYDACRSGFTGVGPLCWRQCPAGMHDDGAFCRRDVQIVVSDNSRCPWYDICGLTLERGCSQCPPGFQNDGCTCRIDAWIFAKETYGRGVGTIPTGCGPGREYDAGLCYPPCRSGFTGLGPVCWDSCPPGFDDHGATCYRPPNVLVKF